MAHRNASKCYSSENLERAEEIIKALISMFLSLTDDDKQAKSPLMLIDGHLKKNKNA